MTFYSRGPGKYGNKKDVASDGTVLDSKRERRRYEELLLLQKMGKIRDLHLQVKYVLIPKQPEFGERECCYMADFTYFGSNGEFHCEDSKGAKTKDYTIKRKLMAHVYRIKVEEV